MINDDYENEIKKIENEINTYTTNKIENENIINTIEILEEKYKNLLEHKFDEHCQSCINNKQIHFKMGYLEDINKLKENIKILNEDLYQEHIKKIDLLKQLLNNDNEINTNKLNLEICLNNLEIEKNKKEIFMKNKEIIEYNKILEKKIINKENEIQKNKNEITKINKYIEFKIPNIFKS
jgi:hypothetical protein